MTKEYVKNYPEQISEINNALGKIAEVVKTLPESASFTKSLNTSLVNFQKKIDSFLVVSAKITDKQKAAIAAIKAGKSPEEISAILTADTSGNDTEESSAGSNDEKPAKKASKSRK